MKWYLIRDLGDSNKVYSDVSIGSNIQPGESSSDFEFYMYHDSSKEVQVHGFYLMPKFTNYRGTTTPQNDIETLLNWGSNYSKGLCLIQKDDSDEENSSYFSHSYGSSINSPLPLIRSSGIVYPRGQSNLSVYKTVNESSILMSAQAGESYTSLGVLLQETAVHYQVTDKYGVAVAGSDSVLSNYNQVDSVIIKHPTTGDFFYDEDGNKIVGKLALQNTTDLQLYNSKTKVINGISDSFVVKYFSVSSEGLVPYSWASLQLLELFYPTKVSSGYLDIARFKIRIDMPNHIKTAKKFDFTLGVSWS